MSESVSLFDHIRSEVRRHKENGELPEAALPPDTSTPIRFADGALDGIAMYHTGASEITDEARALMKKAVQAAASGDHDAAEQMFTELGRSVRALALIDELQKYILDNKAAISAGQLGAFTFRVMTESGDRECVKYALSIMELLTLEGNEQIKDIVAMLGLCNEFTLFALFAMSRWSDANDYTFYLALNTCGWGRIHAVDRLSPDNEEIRKWLLREGVHNTVLPAYSSLACWNKSGARELLKAGGKLSDVDFHGIRDIIEALLDEGPCNGISVIENAEESLMDFLKLASGRALDIRDYEAVRNIREYGGSGGKIAALCDIMLCSEECRECVRLAVREGKGIELAKSLGIDCNADILALLEADIEKNACLCVHLLGDDEYRAKAIAAFCEKLPLEEMKAAPTTELGLGQDFKRENALDFIVQYLGGFPLEGVELVKTALQCSPPRNRNFALRALQSWVNAKQTPLEKLLPEIYALICGLKDGEPDDKVRERMEKLIRGEIDDNAT